MPLPMSPPPSTATHFMGRGLRPASVTPATFLVERCAKKMCTSALCVSSAAAAAKHSTSFFRPASPPCATPYSMASMHSSGCASPRARLAVSDLAISNTVAASPNVSSLSVRYSDSMRGLRPSAMSSAMRRAASSSCACGTTSSTSPSFLAAPSLMGADVSIISSAFCRPTRRGRRCVPPNPGRMPSCSSGRPMRVPGVHTRALHAMATSSPPPRATPWIAATVGLGPFSSTVQKASLMDESMPPPPDWFLNCWISKPGEKLLLAPVTTIALQRGSSCARLRLSNKERRSCGCRAFSGL
mmetsp:Transcript_5505/g.13639  ORF Transcript_5505/g.13639 Transcript_5505/m.13639 type:complete len:299 (+) Transcript_5505:1838-2734(+)